jgi:plasmid stability protein
MSRTIQVRDVPDDVHEVLRVRAARAGLSLSEYLRREVSGLARRPTAEEFLARVTAREEVAVDSEQIVDAVHAERDAR